MRLRHAFEQCGNPDSIPPPGRGRSALPGFFDVATEKGKPERYDYERSFPERLGTRFRVSIRATGTSLPHPRERDGRLWSWRRGRRADAHVRGVSAGGAGEERDYFLHVTGWAKDQDPNTQSSRTVIHCPKRKTDVDPLRTRRVPALVPLSLPKAAEKSRTQIAHRFSHQGDALRGSPLPLRAVDDAPSTRKLMLRP
jgi:hypothetical protein